MLEIQLNSLDEYDRVKPPVFGVFRGMAEFDVVLIGDFQIYFYDIRHIKIHKFLKWSAVETLEASFIDVEFSELTEEESKTTSIAYVQCSCGCLTSRVSRDSDKFKCSLCKRVFVLKKES